MTKRPENLHSSYHAHIYFDQAIVDFAEQFCQTIREQFQLTVGRVHRKPVGPHTRWSCQIIFEHQDFDRLVPWLDENRSGLDVLIHALTDEALKDHTEYAYWLGNEVELDLSIFR